MQDLFDTNPNDIHPAAIEAIKHLAATAFADHPNDVALAESIAVVTRFEDNLTNDPTMRATVRIDDTYLVLEVRYADIHKEV